MEIYDWDKTIHTNYLQTCFKKKTLELHIPKWDLLPMLKYEQLKKLALLLYTSISNRNVRIKMIKIMFSKVSFLYSFQVWSVLFHPTRNKNHSNKANNISAHTSFKTDRKHFSFHEMVYSFPLKYIPKCLRHFNFL